MDTMRCDELYVLVVIVVTILPAVSHRGMCAAAAEVAEVFAVVHECVCFVHIARRHDKYASFKSVYIYRYPTHAHT